jgi:hypothetical protein
VILETELDGMSAAIRTQPPSRAAQVGQASRTFTVFGVGWNDDPDATRAQEIENRQQIQP